jgi:serine phosphatase RsbU (regulator of sigma subunit)
MLVLVREFDVVVAELSFDDEDVFVGSKPTCNIHLPDTAIAERNALLKASEDGKWYIETLDFSKPVVVNGQPIQEKLQLKHGDQVELNQYQLQINLTGDTFEEKVLDREMEDPRLSPEELARIKEFPLPAGSIVKRRFDPVTLTTSQLADVANILLQLVHCPNIHELVELALTTVVRALDAKSAWIGIRRQAKGELEIMAGKRRSGHTAGLNPIIELLQYRCVERSQQVCIRKVRDVVGIGSAMAVPLRVREGTIGMLYVDRAGKIKRYQAPDLDLLTVLASNIAAKVKTALDERMQRTAEVSATEVSVAHKIQTQLDPKTTPTWPGYQLSAYLRSGQESPGDVYDVMKHPDSELSAFLLGHVEATGAALALSLARLHSTFRVGFLHKDPPHAFNRALNWLMYDEKDPSTIHTLCLMLDPKSGKFKYSRAGRVGAFIVSANGEPRRLEGADGPATGRVRNYDYTSQLGTLTSGETLVLYSRGVATATNADGERYSEARFIQSICDGYDEAPNILVQDIAGDLNTFFEDGRHPDDITIILLRRRGD